MASYGTDTVQQELARMRAALLDGRGPGATAGEISRHTRDRQWLGKLPTPVALESVADQAHQARTEMEFSSSRSLEHLGGLSIAIAAAGGLALLANWLLRKTRSRRRPGPGAP